MRNWDIEARIDELAYDILWSLQADMPVSAFAESELCALLSETDEEVSYDASEGLRELTEFLLDYNGDRAWNIANLLLGGPVI